MDRGTIALIVYAAGTLLFAFMLGGTFFEHVMLIPRWREPGGLAAWRSFTGDHHNGYFFLPFGFAALVCLAGGTALGWQTSPARNPYAFAATAILLAGLIFTGVYFIPRNRLLFLPSTPLRDDAEAAALLKQWIGAQYVRLTLLLGGLASAVIGLRK